jgi:hypothetical protein
MEQLNNTGFEDEPLLQMQVKGVNAIFELKQSSASCKLSDIKSFTFCGLSSRFWMFRKHILQEEEHRLTDKHMHFYAWQCITLELQNERVVDLVIKNEKCMDNFLRILIHELNTVDGHRDSAKQLKETLTKQQFRQIKEHKLLHKKQPQDSKSILEQVNLMVLKQVLLKYKIMRIRSKISFSALKRRMAVKELIIRQILDSYISLNRGKNQQIQLAQNEFKILQENQYRGSLNFIVKS